ncbi:restriction endonuclease subunit S [Streptomyces tibetensis]|uniref:restriction endonuclease subunit S n=1 Tax=Streptomyces tibetensis TaxID=2382123 RepID=UPI00340814ED
MTQHWFDQAPEHWEIKRLKYSVESAVNGVWGDEPTGDDTDVLCVRVADFDRSRMRVSDDIQTLRHVSERDLANRRLQPGDLLLEKSGGTPRNPVGFVAIFEGADRPAVCSNFISRIRVAPGNDPRFWLYAHTASYATRLTERSLHQTTGIQNLDQQSYFDEHFPYPPLCEQHIIAQYLDRETSQIDELIDEQYSLVSMLRARRTALVERAVSRGLSSSFELRSSGLSWAPKVPAHWGVANIRRFAQMKTGHTPSRSKPEFWDNCTIPWMTLADVWQLRPGKDMYIQDTESKISALGLANSAAELLPAGTVVLSRTASVGFSGIMPEPMATSQDYWNWVCGPDLMPEYLVWLFRAMRQEFNALMMGSTHKTIYQPIAAAIRIPVPPRDEQQAIVDYIVEHTARIDELIAESECLVKLSLERRSALITAAVTGQIPLQDMRN